MRSPVRPFPSGQGRFDHAGFSLLEILLVLGIASAIIIAAFVIYPKVKAASSTSQEAQNVASIAASVRDLYQGSGDYSTINTAMLVKAGVFPANMLSADGATVNNVWGGTVNVIVSPNINRAFEIVETRVPQADCNRFVVAVESSFNVVRINGWFPKSDTTTFSVSNLMQQPCFDTPDNNTILLDSH